MCQNYCKNESGNFFEAHSVDKWHLQGQKRTAFIYSKLWCKSTTKPAPVLRIATSRGFSELTINVIRSSHGHFTPSLNISCKSVQPFSRNLADKETKKKKERNKQTNRSKTIPRPLYYRERGNDGRTMYTLTRTTVELKIPQCRIRVTY